MDVDYSGFKFSNSDDIEKCLKTLKDTKSL